VGELGTVGEGIGVSVTEPVGDGLCEWVREGVNGEDAVKALEGEGVGEGRTSGLADPVGVGPKHSKS
jgi:hypothetical protein